MCTAVTYQTKDFYMGRTLDYEFSYGNEITIVPRNYPISFRYMGCQKQHYAIIGMAHVEKEYPLYYDAVNEKGLGMAGLNFVGNAQYQPVEDARENVAQYEFILWILCQCDSVSAAKKLLENMNLVATPFSDHLPTAQLHWLLADKNEALTIECTRDGLHLYDNPVGSLTNNPPFPMQMFSLNNYQHLSTEQPKNLFSDQVPLSCYSRGMGSIGLPGDLSSMSRFVRVAFTKLNSVSGDSELESVNQFFHILNSVDQTRGLCQVSEGKYEITLYTSCWNASRGIYYYTTYDNHQICAVDLQKEDLDSQKLICYPMLTGERIYDQN